MLAKNVQLIEALQEIRIHEEDTSFLSPQCQYILGEKSSPPLHLLPSSFPPSPSPFSSPLLFSFASLSFSLSLSRLPSPLSPSLLRLPSLLSLSLSLRLFSISPALPPENAELMLEEIKQQPCMIERLYGELA